jgi:hypothetical protein
VAQPAESPKPLFSPGVQALLALIPALLPAMTAILGGLWVVFTYLDHQQEQDKAQRRLAEQQQAEAARQTARQQEDLARQNNIRQFEARKPFVQKQFDLYNETAAVVGRLITLDPKSDEWAKSSIRFWQLYWSELSVVEDKAVEAAMVRFGNALQAFHRDQRTQVDLQQASIDLAHALRKSIEESWRVQQ